ncbi:flagellin [Thalassorhabdomicrobium marinisediminis]|uniref:flagellin n=1 Tax=Thalassorhabdomicrobium marinisediminis TaxID=2170577 RepID=UPI0024900222|nr:flagellin [Thalassorhabdomicrobium marinisediminis]
MPLSTIGDMRQHFMTGRANTALKTDLQTLVQELTTGEKADLTAHLGASQAELTSVDRQLALLDRFAQSNQQTSLLLSQMQVTLEGVSDQRDTASAVLLSVNSSSDLSEIGNAAQVAEDGFTATVQMLNSRSGDRSMFAGRDLGSNALAPAEDMLAALRGATAGLSDAPSVEAAVAAWFDAPGGGFETTGYLADAGAPLTRAIDGTQSVEIAARADDQALRDTMKAFALGALAADPALGISTADRQALQRSAGEGLLTVATPLAHLQTQIGYAEGRVEEASVRIAAQQSSFGIARNDLVSADPFETATRLQEVQQQLDTHYTLTARLSRLTLTEYLR